MTRTQIVIAGAGPVGTVAAYYLAEHGIDVTVLEAAPTCMEDLRASTYHPPTLEMMDQLGIAQDLIDQGLVAPVYQYRNRATNEVFDFDLTEISDITKFPYRLQCEQYKMAGLLADKLNAHPHAKVLFNHRVVHFEDTDDGVIVNAEGPLSIETFKADYLIAADGANSIVRKWLDVQFEGFTWPEKFLTLSTSYPIHDHFENLSYVNYVADPSEWLVLLKVPSVWRILVPANEDTPNEELVSDENKAKVFNRLVGDEDIKTEHRTIYRVHQRVATKYNHNHVILIGDAAHLNNPLGGLGMNSGIHDAWNLCERLVSIIKENADAEPLLDQFDRQRRSVMHSFIQAQTIRNKKMMEAKDEEAQKEFRDEMEGIHSNPEARRDFMMRQSMFQSLRDAAAIA